VSSDIVEKIQREGRLADDALVCNGFVIPFRNTI